MKTTRILVWMFLTSLALSAGAFAAGPRQIIPCSQHEKTRLMESLTNWAKEGYANSAFMVNRKGQLIGYFAWDRTNGMHAEICDPLRDAANLTVQNEWYYWDSDDSSNPRTWKTGLNYGLSQDEGKASLKVLSKSRNGNIVCELSVIGWGESSDEKVVRKDIVTLIKK